MSKDRFDRLDDDLFEKAPAPPPEPARNRFTREDVIQAARTQAERLRAQGVSFNAETVARLEAEQRDVIIDSLRNLVCPRCGRNNEGVQACTGCRYVFEQVRALMCLQCNTTNLNTETCTGCGRALVPRYEDEPHTVSGDAEETAYDEDPLLPSRPREWLFHVCTEPMDSALGERPWVVFTPIAYWRTHHAQIDQGIEEYAIGAHIPAYLEEVSDSTFVILNSGPTPDMVRDDLRARGFQEDPRFAAWVDPAHPNHNDVVEQRARSLDPHEATREAIQASHERDDHEVPSAGQRLYDAAAQHSPEDQDVTRIETREITLPLLSPDEQLAFDIAREQEQELRRRQYRELLNVENPHMWCFTVTHTPERDPVLVLVHRFWWEAYQDVPDVRVTGFVNNFLPAWIGAEMAERPACFWVDLDESGTNAAGIIGHFERMGLRLIPLIAARVGFPI